jgi:hypothetical protein
MRVLTLTVPCAADASVAQTLKEPGSVGSRDGVVAGRAVFAGVSAEVPLDWTSAGVA